jgi:hypothetical protein
MIGYAADMRFVWFAMLFGACTSAPPAADAPAPQHALGMNDLSMLLPLPTDASTPVLSQVDPLVQTDWFQDFIIGRGDLGPRNGTTYTDEQFQVVALRFDVCDRSTIGPCPANVDGRLRLIVQPVQDVNGAITTVDVAGHLFYPIPAADLASVVDQLRDLAALQDVDSDPLEVLPAADNAEYMTKLKALVLAYARPDNLVRITTAGQVANATPFEWNFREIDWDGSEFTETPIPEVGIVQQSIQLTDGDTTYETGPGDLADTPIGIALAMQGANFGTATQANRMLAGDALAQVLNPTLNDAVNTQCITCHVANYLGVYRSQELGVDPTALPSWYQSTRNIATMKFDVNEPDAIRNFGYVDALPVISQRIANDTAHALDDVDRLFPAR